MQSYHRSVGFRPCVVVHKSLNVVNQTRRIFVFGTHSRMGLQEHRRHRNVRTLI
jgi:hypothetical protein